VIINAPVQIVSTVFIGIVLLLWLNRHSEVAYVLFINAGVFKAAPALTWLQAQPYFDLTAGLAILCLTGPISRIVMGRLKLKRPPEFLIIGYLMVAAAAVVSFLYTAGPIYGAAKLLRFITFSSIALWAPWLILDGPRRWRSLCIAWVVFASVVIINSLSGDVVASTRFREAFESSGYLAVATCSAQALIICGIYIGELRGKLLYQAALAFCGVLFSVGIFVSGSRTGPLAFLLMAALVGPWLLRERRLSARRAHGSLTSTIAAAVLLVGAMAWIGAHNDDMFALFVDRTELLYVSGGEDEYTRITYAMAGLKIIATNPFGVGIGGFGATVLGWDAPRAGFVHNIVIEIGSELGWMGLSGFITLCVGAFVPFVRRLRRGAVGGMSFCAASLFLYSFLVWQFNGDFNDARALWGWLGILVVVNVNSACWGGVKRRGALVLSFGHARGLNARVEAHHGSAPDRGVR
jgi:hypothetical protein